MEIQGYSPEEYASHWGGDPVYDQPPCHKGDGYLFYNFSSENQTRTIEYLNDFAAAIGRQSASISLTPTSFRQELAGARTFAMMAEVEQMQAAGLALGGSLDNAIVVDNDHILNPGGLRMEAEFARHKLLDAVGDLALAGAALHGVFTAYRSGHALNNQLLRALLADPTAWRLLDAAPIAVAA